MACPVIDGVVGSIAFWGPCNVVDQSEIATSNNYWAHTVRPSTPSIFPGKILLQCHGAREVTKSKICKLELIIIRRVVVSADNKNVCRFDILMPSVQIRILSYS